MRVAFVSFAFGEYSVRLASALAAELDEIGLWLAAAQADRYLDRLDGAVALNAFDKPRMREPHKQLPTIGKLISDLRRFEPDVIHLQQGYLWFNPVLRLLRRFPLVVSVHDPTPHLGDRLGRKTPQFVADMAFRRADGLIVHNDHIREVMEARFDDLAPTFVVPHVTLGELDGDGSGVAHDERANTVLFFGRIWPYKGLEYLIRAEPLIAQRVPDVRFVIAGAGEDFARYRDMMVSPQRFEVINEFIEPARAAELFGAAAVVALPYVDATQSGVIPMAYHYATPVVATDVGGLPAQVDHGRTGFVVPPRDVATLADHVARLLEDQSLRAQMGAAAKLKAETELSADAIAKATAGAYRSVLAGRAT